MALRVEATLKIHSQMVKDGRKKDLEHGKVLSLLIASAISGLIPVALGFTCVLMSWGWGGVGLRQAENWCVQVEKLSGVTCLYHRECSKYSCRWQTLGSKVTRAQSLPRSCLLVDKPSAHHGPKW